MLARTGQRTWEPHRDAAFLDLTFGCGLRPEEARGERWWQALWPTDEAEGVLRVREVIAAGQVAEGKTVGSFRDAPLPRLIADRLREWREIASAHGLPTGLQDFIIPGRAPKIGKRDPGGHMTANQEKKWGGKYLKPRCEAVAAAHPERAYLADATTYAGRRGHISSRLAAGESAPAVASDCGTSRKTIIGHYQEDLGDDFERPYPPFEEQLARAHVEVARIWVPRRRRPRRCAARPAITTGSAPGHREPSRGPAPSIAASARAPMSPSSCRAPTRASAPGGASGPSDRRRLGQRGPRGATLRGAATSPECVGSVSAIRGRTRR